MDPFACVGSILRQVLKDGPEVQQSEPDDISKVHEKHVLFEIVQEFVVAFEPEITKVGSVRVIEHATTGTFLGDVEVTREEVTAVNILFTF